MMKITKTIAAVCITTATTAAFADGHAPSPDATADLIGTDGKSLGTASLFQAATGVLFHVKVSGLTPGKHGLHLHSMGVCEAHEGFKTAKGHVGKTEGGHGLLNPNGPEAGDIPNIFVGADGTGEMEAFSTLVSLTGGEHNLLDADGSTFVIHEAGDDHITQPIGGAGARVACGIITGS